MNRINFLAVFVLLSLLPSQILNAGFAGNIERARKDAAALIHSGKPKAARLSVTKLMTDYAQDPELPSIMYKLAGTYDLRWDSSSAEQLYTQLVRKFGKSDYANKARLQLIRLRIESQINQGNLSTAANFTEQMISQNSGESDLAEILYHIAERYEKCKKPAAAKNLYSRAMKLSGKNGLASKAKLDIARLENYSLIVSGKDEAAGSLIDNLISENSQNPHLPEVLVNIGKGYAKQYKHDKAKALYKKVTDLFPGTEHSLEASLEIAKLEIQSAIEKRDFNKALSLTNQLINSTPDNKHLASVIYSVMRGFANNKETDSAKKLFNELNELYPDNYNTSRSQLDMAAMDIFEKIDAGDLSGAKELTDAMIGSHSKHPYLPEILFDIGSRYTGNQQYEEAKGINNYLIKNYPKNYNASRAKAAIAGLDISAQIADGDFTGQSETDAQINEVIEQFRRDFINDSDFSKVMSCISEAYYLKGLELASSKSEIANMLFGKSVSILEDDVLGNLPDISAKAAAYYVIGLNCDRLGEYAKAAQAFQNAAETNGSFKYADYCVFAAGNCYEKLLSNKALSETDGKAIVSLQYAQLLKDYPYSNYRHQANEWLNNNQ